MLDSKKYLMDYDLSLGLFDCFDLKVKDVIPVRNVFIIITNEGNKILKKIDYSVEELNFIYSAIEYIKKNFNRVFNFVKTKDGNIFVNWNQELYCITDLIEGRECEFINPIDLSMAAKGLGEFHKASEGFRYNLPSKNNCGKIIDSLKRKLDEVEFFKCIVNLYERKNEFDDIFMKNVNYYIEQMKKSIEIMEKTQYYKLCSEEDKIAVCHHDLAHRNILIKNEEAYFIDFDYAVIDIKVHDLCNLISKSIKNYSYDPEKMDTIIRNYCMVNTLDKRELEVLYGMLSFPEDFYDLSKDYYTKRKVWDEDVFLYRLTKKVNNKGYVEDLLQDFNKRYLTD